MARTPFVRTASVVAGDVEKFTSGGRRALSPSWGTKCGAGGHFQERRVLRFGGQNLQDLARLEVTASTKRLCGARSGGKVSGLVDPAPGRSNRLPGSVGTLRNSNHFSRRIAEVRSRPKRLFFPIAEVRSRLKRLFFPIAEVRSRLKRLFFPIVEVRGRLKRLFFPIVEVRSRLKRLFRAPAEVRAARHRPGMPA